MKSAKGRFACRNGTFRALKRTVSASKTAHFGKRNGTQRNTLETKPLCNMAQTTSFNIKMLKQKQAKTSQKATQRESKMSGAVQSLAANHRAGRTFTPSPTDSAAPQ